MNTVERLAVVIALLLTAACLSLAAPQRMLVASCGEGYLERVDGQLVLHAKGTPSEMGRQHGELLKDHVNALISRLEQSKEGMNAGSRVALDLVWSMQKKHVPARYIEEMRALAAAAGVPFDTIRRANSIPELFHCSGFAVFGRATADARLYHGRILDYNVTSGLQDHAIVVIAQPKGYAPFVSVTYAGFVGSVTGMNLKGIGFGEMGGGGVGKWNGTPMSILMRRGLEEARTLAQAKTIFSKAKRTCEYFYVISDANIPSAVAVSATPDRIEFLGPNQTRGPINVPIQDAVVVSAGDRYELLTKRIKEEWGKLDSAACLDLMRRPVAMQSCLHTVLMSPGTGEIWVANATSRGEPASEQPYTCLNVAELMRSRPRN